VVLEVGWGRARSGTVVKDVWGVFMAGTGEVEFRVEVLIECCGVGELGRFECEAADIGRGCKECSSGRDGCCVVAVCEEFRKEGLAARRDAVEGCWRDDTRTPSFVK